MYMQEVHGLNTEVILAHATHILGGSEGLLLFGNGPNTKAIAFSINNSPKELINWRYGSMYCILGDHPSQAMCTGTFIQENDNFHLLTFEICVHAGLAQGGWGCCCYCHNLSAFFHEVEWPIKVGDQTVPWPQ
jgi:hypothetical protein